MEIQQKKKKNPWWTKGKNPIIGVAWTDCKLLLLFLLKAFYMTVRLIFTGPNVSNLFFIFVHSLKPIVLRKQQGMWNQQQLSY